MRAAGESSPLGGNQSAPVTEMTENSKSHLTFYRLFFVEVRWETYISVIPVILNIKPLLYSYYGI